MNKEKSSTRFLLYFFILMFFMLIAGCSSKDNKPAPAPAYTQADLTGTWHAHMLQAGSTNQWQYVTVTIDSTGTLTFADCSTTCPTGPIVWTINSSGVISETDNSTATDSHYTMTSNKNFIAGTGTGGGTDAQLLIAQKVITGTTYSGTELNSQLFVYHILNAGAGTDNMWIYGAGTTNGSGAINISSETTPSGTIAKGDTGHTISVDTSGIVTMTGNDFHGFLSDDKRTIVGTSTNGSGVYALWILQITTGQNVTASAYLGTTFYGHELACGASPAPFWDHEIITVDILGGITLSDFVPSTSVTAPTGLSGKISDSSGTVAIIGINQYNGHISYDGKFVVGTQTDGDGVYSLSIMTR
jgi:hypothetical protein